MRLPAPTILSLLILATPSGLAAMDPGLRTTRPALAPFNLVRERSYQLRQGSTFPLPDTLVAIATVTLDGVEVPFERVLSTSHPLEYRVTIPEATSMRGVPYASVSYGPLLFALPIPDTTDANTPDPSARWRFALDVQKPGLTVERTSMPPRWNWPLNAPLKLQANAVEIAWDPDPKAPRLPSLPATRAKPAESVTLIPYGCTKFRISMFPVTAEPEVRPSAIRRILFLGNSITLHGPKPDIGWTGNWGMAASAEDKDYVHLVTSALANHTGSKPQIMVRNIADFERGYATYDVEEQMKDLFAFDPDLVVLAIGENVPALGSENAKAQFKAGVIRILGCAVAKRHPLVVVRSSFWPDPTKDELLRQACQEADAIFVDAGPLGREAANAARSERSFTHDGVAGHPGDRGMKALADAIVQAVLQRGVSQR